MTPARRSDLSDWLSVDEVAEQLNVKRETVYAYVSRGRLTSRRAHDGRGSIFDPKDVERLVSRSPQARRGRVPETASRISLIRDGELYYRGTNVRKLALERSFEDVAELLWGASPNGPVWTSAPEVAQFSRKVIRAMPGPVLPVDQIKVAAGCAAAVEPPAMQISPDGVATIARRVLATVAASLPTRSEPVATAGRRQSSMAAMLWSRLAGHPPTTDQLTLLNATMILLAEHDLAAATYVVRTAARAGVEPAALIRLGVDVGSGPVKGAASLAIEAFLHDLDSPLSVTPALNRRLREGTPIPGFGHAVYPDGDVRAAVILDLLRELYKDANRMATVEEVIRTHRARALPPPNAGFALAALSYLTGMIDGAGEVIFVLSRAAGWIAHAIEAYQDGPALRPHASYRGRAVDAPDGAPN